METTARMTLATTILHRNVPNDQYETLMSHTIWALWSYAWGMLFGVIVESEYVFKVNTKIYSRFFNLSEQQVDNLFHTCRYIKMDEEFLEPDSEHGGAWEKYILTKGSFPTSSPRLVCINDIDHIHHNPLGVIHEALWSVYGYHTQR
jgi:hypothetical protein